MKRRIFSVMCACLPLLAEPGAADTTSVWPQASIERLSKVEHGTRLLLRLEGGRVLEGLLVRSDSDSLVLSPDLEENMTFGLSEIETLSIPAGNHEVAGTKWGMIAGAVVGAIGLPLLIATHAPCYECDFVGLAFVGLGFGGYVGSIAGNITGRSMIAWERLYP